MRKIKIYDLTFERTARFAPECYRIISEDGTKLGDVELANGLLVTKLTVPKTSGLDWICRFAWEISDLNMFHSQERREKWLTKVAEKVKEALEIYGKN
jgi:hypothetical protein